MAIQESAASTASASPAAASAASSRFALDARGLDDLKRKSRTGGDAEGQRQAVRQAAGQFEAVFMNLLLKSMRDALPQEGMLDSSSTKSFTSMYDQQLTQKMSEKGIGLADMIVKQLENNGATGSRARAIPAGPALTLDKLKGAATDAVRSDGAAGAPQEFVKRMWSSARAAEESTGMPAQFILGQAALESGWGRREIRQPDGSSSHNLFGIKAGASWKGATVDAVTTEYTGGVARKVTEKFRAYSSYAESFADFARLMTSSPRYAGVLKSGGDAVQFAQNMQRAGYATDPQYADKLARTIQQTLRAVA
jgi:peptidoglycan hydrolase FlgJ